MYRNIRFITLSMIVSPILAVAFVLWVPSNSVVVILEPATYLTNRGALDGLTFSPLEFVGFSEGITKRQVNALLQRSGVPKCIITPKLLGTGNLGPLELTIGFGFFSPISTQSVGKVTGAFAALAHANLISFLGSSSNVLMTALSEIKAKTRDLTNQIPEILDGSERTALNASARDHINEARSSIFQVERLNLMLKLLASFPVTDHDLLAPVRRDTLSSELVRAVSASEQAVSVAQSVVMAEQSQRVQSIALFEAAESIVRLIKLWQESVGRLSASVGNSTPFTVAKTTLPPRMRLASTLGWASFGLFSGLLFSAAIALVREIRDTRIFTPTELADATGLPVLATLGDLRPMSPVEQVNWAFRTLTILQGKLTKLGESFVCGFISSHHGEGRSTWINLLVSAASQRGLRVLMVTTRPTITPDGTPDTGTEETSLLPVGPNTTLTKNVLAHPAQLIEQFNHPEAQPIVSLPLPGWVWNLERRKQWQKALVHWKEIDNFVLLIELPPASEPESVLLAENVPQIIWLTDSGKVDAGEVAYHLETLRNARCRLVGAVLNRDPKWGYAFRRWVSSYLM